MTAWLPTVKSQCGRAGYSLDLLSHLVGAYASIRTLMGIMNISTVILQGGKEGEDDSNIKIQ